MDAISIISIFLWESIWFTIYYCLIRFLYMFKIFQLTEQHIYVKATYTNPMFCTYVLHKRHGQFFGAQSRIFFLNSVGDTIPFNSVGKMPQIRYTFWAILGSFNTSTLQRCAISKAIIAFLLGNVSVNISGSMLVLL